MKMTKRIKNFIKDPKSFSCRKIANLCRDEELDHEFLFKYQDYLNWKIILIKYPLQFSFEELDKIIPIARKKRLLWELISTQKFSEEQLDYFIEERIYNYNWIFRFQKVSEQFIEKHFSVNSLYDICQYQTLSEDFIRRHADDINNSMYGGKVDWKLISQYQKLSEQFMRDFNHKLDWHVLPKYQTMSDKFIKEFRGKFWWGDFPYNKLSEELISELYDTVCWPEVSKEKKNLSNKFIETWAHRLDWFNLCYFNKVDSSILSKYADRLSFDWTVLCEHQNLSEDFMREFKDRMYWDKLLNRRLLSKDFIREMNKYFSGYIRMIVKTVYPNNNYSDKFKNELKGLDPSLK